MKGEDGIREKKRRDGHFDGRHWQRVEKKKKYEEPEEEAIEKGLEDYEWEESNNFLTRENEDGKKKEDSASTEEERLRIPLREIIEEE